MNRIKSQIKRNKTNQKKHVINKNFKNKMNTLIKNAKKNNENQKVIVNLAIKQIDKNQAKGIIHKNKANNLKSKLTKFLNKQLVIDPNKNK